MQRIPCKVTEDHDGHDHRASVTFKCTGGTSCGMRVHPEHTWNENQDVYCPGVCTCGAKWGRKPHTPGDHK